MVIGLIILFIYVITVILSFRFARKTFSLEYDRIKEYRYTSHYVGYSLLSFIPLFNLVITISYYSEELEWYYKRHHSFPTPDGIDRFTRAFLVQKIPFDKQ